MDGIDHRVQTSPQLPTPGELLDFLPFGLVIHDEHGQVRKVNRAFAELLGYSVPELMAMEARSIIHPDDFAARTRDTARLVSGLVDSLITERRLIRRDGKVIRVRVNKSLIAAESPTAGPLVLVCVEDWQAEHDHLVDLARAAYHDALTGLFNRAGLIEHLQSLESNEKPPAVALIDLNGLKAVNDRYGHAGGDEYLQSVAKRLSAAASALSDSTTSPSTCLAARLAGDEFVLVWSAPALVVSDWIPGGPAGAAGLIPDDQGVEKSDGLADPQILEQAIRDAMVEQTSIRDSRTGNTVSLKVSASIGAVAMQPWMSPEQVLDHADRLMYADKAALRAQTARTISAASTPTSELDRRS